MRHSTKVPESLQDQYMTAEEAAEALGYEYTSFTRKLKKGDIPGAEQFQGWLVPRSITLRNIKLEGRRRSDRARARKVNRG